MNGPAYDAIEVLHVASAVVAFGSLAATGWYASAARQRAEPMSGASTRRYFRPGRNWAERALFLVPVFGGILVGMGGASIADRAWPWIGLGIWLIAAAAASGGIFPAERVLQAGILAHADLATLRVAARRCERWSAVTSVLFVAALVVMIWQPG
ncbi:MAG: DUF2269 family protein [Acidimicrobiales bacterium]